MALSIEEPFSAEGRKPRRDDNALGTEIFIGGFFNHAFGEMLSSGGVS
jgi:hypothetical protein